MKAKKQYNTKAQRAANAVKLSASGRAARKASGCPFLPATTSDRIYAPDELEFLQAIDAYKRRTGKRFLENCEYFYVMKSLGYQKIVLADVRTGTD